MKNKPSSKLILASASPRRLELLKQIGITPSSVFPADIDETELLNELPKDLAVRLSSQKALKVYEDNKSENSYILAADTVVACGRRILPKGETEKQAYDCLKMLSGRRHRIYGGISVIAPDGKQITKCIQTMVQFKPLSTAEIECYVRSNEWEGKAGAYAIQGLASVFVKKINGSYSNIVGLSCYDTLAMLKGLGFDYKI